MFSVFAPFITHFFEIFIFGSRYSSLAYWAMEISHLHN